MKRFTLDDVIQRSTRYEKWKAELDPRLQQGLVWSGYAIFSAIGFLLLLPVLLPWTRSDLFLVLGPELQGVFLFLLNLMPLLLTVNLIGVIAYIALLWITEGLEKPPVAVWHYTAFAEVALGAVNAFVLALAGAIVVLNLFLWIVAIVIGLLVLFAALGILGAASR
jgi:hypothetical protein